MDKLSQLFVTNLVKYKVASQFGLINEKALYFIEDEDTKVKSIYKGSKKIAGDFIVSYDMPNNPEQGVVYYINQFTKDDDEENPYPFVGIWTGDTWVDFHKDYSGKQDKLTAGKGIDISDENVISSTVDLSIYKIVSELPTEDIDDNKIYLMVNTAREIGNKYIEYIHHPDGWEILGEYKAEISLDEYIKTVDADKKYVPRSSGSSSSGSAISISTNGSFNNYGNNGQAFNAVRDLTGTSKYQTVTGSGYPLNAASFGVKDTGTTAFSHKKYDTFNKETGAATGAKNTAVLVFSGNSGLMYAKNTGSGNDVTDDMYKYVGVIDSPDEKQRVYSKAQVDELVKGLTDTISALEARIQDLENK